MLMIRFQRIGRTNDPAFRIVVLEKERAAKAGNIVELLGTYNPRSKALTLNEDRVKHWISKGAQPTGSIHNLLVNKRFIEGKMIGKAGKTAEALRILLRVVGMKGNARVNLKINEPVGGKREKENKTVDQVVEEL